MPGTAAISRSTSSMRELHLHARLLAARLLAGAPREDADDVGAPLREDRLDRLLNPAP